MRVFKKRQQKKTASSGALFVLSGPSGVGKTVVARSLVRRIPRLHRIVTYTSRAKRPGERQRLDYYFVSPQEFRSLLNEDFFLEWAEVHNHLYGTPYPPIKKYWEKGHACLLVIDVQGAREVRRKHPESILIFLKPDNIRHLASRIRKRKENMSEEELVIRLANAKREIEIAEDEYDYIIVNREKRLKETIEKTEAIIRENMKSG